jgi:hypothetical protein
MTIRKYLYIAIAFVLTACSEQDAFDDPQEEMGRMPVLFSAGNTDATITRASASASYMPQDSRFVCSMFFHAGANDTNDSAFYASKPIADVSMTTTWLKINNSIGNAVYWNNKYQSAEKTDIYGFDEAAKCFYWQNRLSHVFLALADYHKLSEDDGDTGSLKLYPDITSQYNNQYMVAYDLTRGDKTAMKQQPDPILAIETAQPSGATPEANRVKLFFKHQFSQIQVNLKNSQDESVTIDSTLILSVELLGVAETGYVAYCIQPDGTVPSTTSAPINIDDVKYAATKKDNPYGSSFNMFKRSTTATGYLKSFEGIAFGTLEGIRITWKESADANAIKHVATFKGLDTAHKNLESGVKYIYNMELRRSLIAQVTAEITPWEIDKTTYEADATIVNND